MSEELIKCPLCQMSGARLLSMNGQIEEIFCPTCGKYEVTGSAHEQFQAHPPSKRFVAWVRAQTDSSAVPRIDSNSPNNVEPTLAAKSWTEKQRLLLGALARRSNSPGEQVKFSAEHDWPVSWSDGPRECAFVLQALKELGYMVVPHADQSGNVRATTQPVTVTHRGWTFLEESEQHSDATQAFVAMSFDPSLLSAWKDALKPAIVAAGWVGYRVDEKPHADRIDVRIMAEIRRSRFVVADVTLQRPGVYFEAGFALGLGIPVIWCVKETDAENVHFDTRQYNHIRWKDETELREKAEYFIRGVIGTGPRAQ